MCVWEKFLDKFPGKLSSEACAIFYLHFPELHSTYKGLLGFASPSFASPVKFKDFKMDRFRYLIYF